MAEEARRDETGRGKTQAVVGNPCEGMAPLFFKPVGQQGRGGSQGTRNSPVGRVGYGEGSRGPKGARWARTPWSTPTKRASFSSIDSRATAAMTFVFPWTKVSPSPPKRAIHGGPKLGNPHP